MEAEKSVIGSVLLNGKLEDLQSVDFTCPDLSIIWDAILEVSASGQPIDLTTVATKIHSWGKSEQIGSPEILAELQNNTPTGTHSTKYANIVKNVSIRREIQEVLDREIESDATNEEVIGHITTSLQSLARPVHNRSIVELLSEFEKQKKENKKGLMTGFKWLDDKTNGIGEGMFWMITAKSFVGKTTFALQAIRNICDTTGQKCVLYTLEQSDLNVMKTLSRVQRNKKQQMEQLSMMRLDIIDSLRSWDAIAIDAQKRDAKVIIVDYAQMVGIGGKGIYEKMENLAFAIRGFCNKTKIAVVLISQISEETRRSSGSHDGAKGGSALFDASDVFLNLRGDAKAEREQRERDEHYSKNPSFGNEPKEFTREVIIAKNKYGDIGYRQTQFNYALGYGTYSEF